MLSYLVQAFRRARTGILPFCAPKTERSVRLPAGARAQILPLRARASLFAAFGLFALYSSGAQAQAMQGAAPDTAKTEVTQPMRREAAPDSAASPPSDPVRIGGTRPEGPCVQVDIAGHRAGHLDCASQALREAGRVAQREARAGIDTPVAGAGSPDTEIGVASLPGSRLRMGRNLGRSVYPDRPHHAPPPARPGNRP